MNPNVMEPVHRILGRIPQILLVKPLSYPNMVNLMQKCYFVLTDSGGIQEEALALSIPVLVMRDTTERDEGVRAGGSLLVGTDFQSIVSKATKLIKDEKLHRMMSDAANPYGNGTAAAQIVSVLIGKM
jgi:UDP-N-acetylglucosamine 2-epimerase (non-hydrolysing)